jgi:hypothetical protein
MPEKIPQIDFFDDEFGAITLSCIYIVCPSCQGKGTKVNPAIDSHGITQEEFDRDPEFKEQYLAGWYDIDCPHCNGKRVVPTPCKFTNSKEHLGLYETHLQEEAEYDALCAAEWRMGC